MSFVAAIWVVLLHALAGPTALPVQAWPEAARARIEATAPRRSDAAVRPPQAPAEAIRAIRDIRTLVAARSGGRAPIDGTPASHQVAAVRRPLPDVLTGRVLRTAGRATHRVASRGALLPFFPTAPPVPV